MSNLSPGPIKWKVLPHRNKDLPMPSYATDGAAGFDLIANEAATITQGQSALISTGLAVEIPKGWVLLVCSRSGLAAKQGLIALNAPGVVDEDFRGEIKVILACTSSPAGTPQWTTPRVINVGDRIAQALMFPSYKLEHVVVDELSETARGAGGFGSTGA